MTYSMGMSLFHAVTLWLSVGWLVAVVLHLTGVSGGSVEGRKELGAMLFCMTFGPALVLMALFTREKSHDGR